MGSGGGGNSVLRPAGSRSRGVSSGREGRWMLQGCGPISALPSADSFLPRTMGQAQGLWENNGRCLLLCLPPSQSLEELGL